MKTKTNIIASLVAATTTLLSGMSQAVERTLILLQENSNGGSYLEDYEGDTTLIDDAIDFFAEASQSVAFAQRSLLKYNGRFINLSDTACTRENLLNALIRESQAGRTIDLAILGHGGKEVLGLHDGETLTGMRIEVEDGRLVSVDPGNIRTMLRDARARTRNPNFRFNLRLVYMCNCFGATLNNDWRFIGAKTSVGAPGINWMPVPMIDVFWNNFLFGNKTAKEAMNISLAETRRAWRNIPGYNIVDPEKGVSKLQETEQESAGNSNLIFSDEFQIPLGTSKEVTVRAADFHNFADLFIAPGERYSFSATGRWKSTFLAPEVSADGQAPTDGDGTRRFANVDMMKLCGETFTANRNILTNVSNSKFSIGTSRAASPERRGFLSMFANDDPLFYFDNGGAVTVTIRRTR